MLLKMSFKSVEVLILNCAEYLSTEMTKIKLTENVKKKF